MRYAERTEVSKDSTICNLYLAYTALPGGETVGQWMQPQIAAAYQTGRMPPLLPWSKP